MGKERTELVFIVDKSGSMAGQENDVIGGFNSMFNKLGKEAGDCRVTTVLFDNNYHLLHDRVNINETDPLRYKDYVPGGGTALMDAVGYAIDKLESVQTGTSPEFRAKNVIFVIITDGEENSSRKYSLRQIKESIEKEKNCGWEFIFMGANIDAVETAAMYGIREDRALNYVPDGQGTRLNYDVMSDALCFFAETGAIKNETFNPIRADMKKRGGK